jgi:membrane protease YdiL (CAAX protease family)
MTSMSSGPECGAQPSAAANDQTIAGRRGALRRLIAEHPVAAFCVMAFATGWPWVTAEALTGFTPLLSVAAFGALLGSALLVTWAGGGREAVIRFLSRYLIWRFGVARWAFVLLAMPTLTIAVAAASGTLRLDGHGWAYAIGAYLVQTLVTGALAINFAEEGAWSGLVYTRFAARNGMFGAALRTAPLFVAIHLPLQFTPGWTWGSVITQVAVLMIIAPFFRYVIAASYEATGGSLLAAGILHASFNASGKLGFPGGWQFLPAILLLAAGVAVVRRFRRRSVSARA